MTFGKNLIECRKVANMSQEDLAKITGIKREYISKFENEHLKNPTLKIIRKFARAFNKTISAFTFGID